MKQNKIPRNEYIRKPVGKTNPYKEDVIYSNLGQWKYPGEVTRIPSGDITMQGVPYPVYGEDNLGYSQMMYPGMDYQFPGQYVTEYPMAMYGGDPSLSDITGHYPFGGQNTKTHTHMSKGGWLDEYQTKGEVIHTDKALYDKAYRAERDSSNLYNLSNKLARGSYHYSDDYTFPANPKYWDDYKITYKEALEREKPGSNFFGQVGQNSPKAKYRDIVLESYKKKIKPLGYTHGDVAIPVYKKPVIHNVYKEEPPPPPVKKKDKPKEKGLPPGVIRQWNFNSNVGPVMIYKKGDQEVGREYYRDGKPYETHYGNPTGETTIDTIPFDPARIKKEGGWLDEYQMRGEVLPSETTQSMIPAGLKYKMDQLKKQDPKYKKKLEEEKKFVNNVIKAKEDVKKQEVAERKARIADSIDAQKETIIGNPNWRENLARQTQAIGDKFRVSDEPNFFDDYINPGVWIGDMASGLGQAPYVAKETDSNLPYVLGVGAPLVTGALEGIGGKSTKDFITNLISPIPFTGEAINKGLKGVKKLPSVLKKSLNKETKPFKSEIDWGKWNPETPKHKVLMDEYNAIEQSSKKAGTWMKNADGSPYQGTPEQFVQEQSSWFKKAYPQGYDETYRGVGITNTNPDFSKGTDLSYNPEYLTGDRGIFTANYDLAKEYAIGAADPKILNPFSPKGQPGVFNLIHPKGKQIDINTLYDDWQNVDLRKANKTHLQADLDNKKMHLEKMKSNPYANEKIIKNHEKRIEELQQNINELDSRITDPEELSKLRANVPTIPSTDDIAAYLPKSDLRKVTLRNIIDGAPGDVTIVNNKPGNYLKSRVGNVGFFDMTNPNIYKALVPAAIATGAYQQQEEGGEIGEDDFRRGGPYTPPKLKRKVKKQGTSKNIQSSINKLFTRNYDVFGPGGKNIYNPNVYKTGGWLDSFLD